MSIAEISTEALSLSDEDRAELANLILDSLQTAPDPNDSGLDSLSEAKIRGDELASGKVEGISKEEFLNGFRRERGQ